MNYRINWVRQSGFQFHQIQNRELIRIKTSWPESVIVRDEIIHSGMI